MSILAELCLFMPVPEELGRMGGGGAAAMGRKVDWEEERRREMEGRFLFLLRTITPRRVSG